MTVLSPLTRQFWIYIGQVAIVAACYFGMTKFILMIPLGDLPVWPLWIPAGFAQAIVLWRPQLWAGIGLGSLLLTCSTQGFCVYAVLSSINNALQPLIGAWLLQRVGFKLNLERLCDVLSFLGFAAVMSSIASATFGIANLLLTQQITFNDAGAAWFDWWIGNVIGILVLTPILITYRRWPTIFRRSHTAVEITLWLSLLIGLGGLIFYSYPQYSLAYLMFPLLIWGSLRFGQPGTTLAIAIIIALVIWGFLQGHSPFGDLSGFGGEAKKVALRISQAYVCVVALTGMVLAAIMAERDQNRNLLQIEKEKSEQLLLNILPEPVADRLKQQNGIIADSFSEATVMFADIANFTQMSAAMPAEEMVALLNEIFSTFDSLAERYHLEKIKTIGDAYMVVGGLPYPNQDHAIAVADMAIAMQAEIERFSKRHHKPFAMRIGINTGPVVAGVIGRKKFIYDLWGDTVNIASRMESEGIVSQIQVTEATYERLRHQFALRCRGRISVKGRGEMVTYLLVGRMADSVSGSKPSVAQES